MAKKPYHRKISGRRGQLGPYPMERLIKVEQPTTRIIDDIPRFDEREHGFARAKRGDCYLVTSGTEPDVIIEILLSEKPEYLIFNRSEASSKEGVKKW